MPLEAGFKRGGDNIRLGWEIDGQETKRNGTNMSIGVPLEAGVVFALEVMGRERKGMNVFAVVWGRAAFLRNEGRELDDVVPFW